MKALRIALFVPALLATASLSGAQTLDWHAVQKITPSTGILVETQKLDPLLPG
ncbi:MAG: hypothetical protein WA414_06010 [Acidobacteriaceae bacterium]